MPDSIGRITVPELTASGTFPLTAEYAHSHIVEPIVKVHRFYAGNGKITQRFLLGNKAKRWSFRKKMPAGCADAKTLRDFWEARSGPLQPFTFNAPGNAHGDAPVAKTVRFANEVLSFEHLKMMAETGIEFVEIPTATPSHTPTSTLERFPDAGMETSMESQVQEFIPLLKISVQEAAVSDVFISDRRVTVGGQLYLERLLDWGPIRQSINGQSDQANFVLGNADRVMSQFAADTRTDFAQLSFSLYHVNSLTLVNLWSGPLAEFSGEASTRFNIVGRDPLFDVRMRAPARSITRRCWKKYDDDVHCDFFTHGSLDLGGFPSADAAVCDKGFGTPNGCEAHQMDTFFGGHPIFPQRIRFKDPGNGNIFGTGRPTITSASIITDSVFGRTMRLIFTDVAIPVQCDVIAGRDESEFYVAMGVVGEGPLGSYGTGHRLDGQAHHGPGGTGLATITGTDPQATQFGVSPDVVDERSAGTAWVEIRRTDAEGIQLAQNAQHEMTAIVDGGLKVHTWVSGVRQAEAVETNPVWVAIYVYLRLFAHHRTVAAAAQEALFDVAAAEAAVTICDTLVTRLIGAGTVKQFQFIGFLDTKRPIRDWLKDILSNCLGYYTFVNGKLRIGIRVDSASTEAFTTGNVLFGSYEPLKFPSSFNQLVVNYGLREVSSDGLPTLTLMPMEFANEDAAEEESQTDQPMYRPAEINLAGVHTQDQAARIATTMVREETGGVTAAHRKVARGHRFSSTVLSLAVEPGMVVSGTGIPGAPESPFEMRVEEWVLHSDYRLDMVGRSTQDDMYDLLVGSTAVDVEPDTPPDEVAPQLAAGVVTGFNLAEDPEVQPDGTVLSLVTASFTEPSPLNNYRGLRLYGRDLDTTLTNGSGTPTNDYRLVAYFPEEASPLLREFRVPVTGLAMRVKAVSYNGVFESDFALAPEDEVLLDGKQSAPTTPSSLHCQNLPASERLSWEKNPENDLAGYKVAWTGDKIPYVQSAIKANQVIASVPKSTTASDRNSYVWVQEFLEMDISGSVLTLAATPTDEWFVGQLMVETAAAVFTGITVTIFYSNDLSEQRTPTSNGVDSITVSVAPSQTGRVRVRLGGAANEQRFHINAFDTTGNESAFVAFPECSPLASDGSHDVGVPECYKVSPGVDGSYFTVGLGVEVATGVFDPGKVAFAAVARASSEAETEYLAALKQNIGGIVAWETMLGVSDSDNRIDVTTVTLGTPTRILTASAHGLTTGDWVVMDRPATFAPVNGIWQVTVIDADEFDLDGSDEAFESLDDLDLNDDWTMAAVSITRHRFQATRTEEHYVRDALGFWKLTNAVFLMDAMHKAVHGVSLRAENSFGSSRWLRLPADIVGLARPPFFAGSSTLFENLNAGLTGSQTNFQPNIAESVSWSLDLLRNIIIDAPDNLDLGSTTVFAAKNGQTLTFIITQNASTAYTVTWNSAYKGVTDYPMTTTLSKTFVYHFHILSPTNIVLLGIPHVAGTGGNTNYSGAYSDLASVTGMIEGDVFYFTEGTYYDKAIYNGSSWDLYYGNYKVTPFVPGDYTWDFTPGTFLFTHSQVGGATQFSLDAGNGQNIIAFTKAIPTAPWRVTMLYVRSEGPPVASFVLGDGTKYDQVYQLSTGGQGLHWSDRTTQDGGSFSYGLDPKRTVFWVRVEDNGSNRVFWYSRDGVTWNVGDTVSQTNYLTPTTIGPSFWNLIFPGIELVTILSWKED